MESFDQLQSERSVGAFLAEAEAKALGQPDPAVTTVKAKESAAKDTESAKDPQ